MFRSGSAWLPPPSQLLLCSVVWPRRRPPPVLAAAWPTRGAGSKPSVPRFQAAARDQSRSPKSLGGYACVRQARPTKFKIFLMEAGMPDVSRRRVADESDNSPKPCGSFPEIRTDLPLGHARGSLRTAGVTLVRPPVNRRESSGARQNRHRLRPPSAVGAILAVEAIRAVGSVGPVRRRA